MEEGEKSDWDDLQNIQSFFDEMKDNWVFYCFKHNVSDTSK